MISDLKKEEYRIRNNMNGLHGEYNDAAAHLKSVNHLMVVSKWLTFGLYLAFTLSLYLGDILHLQTLITSFMSSAIGFIFYLAICLGLAYVLAGIKHAAYDHFSIFKKVSIFILVVVVSMGLLAEMFQSSGNQDTKARAITEASPEYQQLINTSPASSMSPDPGLVIQIAEAKKKLARCKEKLAEGKEKHCKGDAAKLESYQHSQTQHMTNQNTVATAAIDKQYARLDKIKDDSYNPIVRSISELTGLQIASGIALIMFIIAANFEIMHYWLSAMKSKVVVQIQRLKDAIREMEIAYFNVVGVEFDGQAHSEFIEEKPEAEPAPTPPQSDWKPFGNATPATAASAQPAPNRFKYQAPRAEVTQPVPAPVSKKAFIGFVNPSQSTMTKTSSPHPNARPDALAAPEKHPNHRLLGSKEEQLIVPGTSTYNAELANHNIDSPADKALNKEADQATIQRIINKGLKASSTHPEDGLGMDSQNRPAPHPDAHPDGSADHSQDGIQSTQTAQEIMADAGKLEVIKGYMEHEKFNEIFVAVCTGQTKPSQNGIKAHKVGGDMPKYVLVIMCYLDLVSEPKANKQRNLVEKLTPEQAQQELLDAREIILGKE